MLRLFAIASCLCLLPSCGVLTSILKIPASILQAAGRTVGVGLTDDAPQPYDDESGDKQSGTVESAATEREKVSD